MCAFGLKRAVVSAQGSIAVRQYYHKYRGIWLDKCCLTYGTVQIATNILKSCNLKDLDSVFGLSNHRKPSKLRLVILLN